MLKHSRPYSNDGNKCVPTGSLQNALGVEVAWGSTLARKIPDTILLHWPYEMITDGGSTPCSLAMLG